MGSQDVLTSTHDEPCLLPRRSPWRAPHLLTSNPRRTLPCTTQKPLAASPHLLTFNPRRSLPSRTAMPLAVPLHLLTFNPRRSLPSPNDEAIRPLNSCSLSRPSTCSTFAQVMRPLGASLQGTASPASGIRCVGSIRAGLRCYDTCGSLPTTSRRERRVSLFACVALESGDEGPLRLLDEGHRHGAGMGTKRAAAPTRRLEPALQRY